jgi:energy-coupling factor transporter ATP-binding protein EcfA2
MKDKRITELETVVAEPKAAYTAGPVRIDRIKISNYKFFHGDFELHFGGNNVLIYGENGTGKSSIYRALELLTKENFESIDQYRNIFSEEDEPVIEFLFTSGKELIITRDLTELPDGMDFLKGLSVFTPMLDYKKLLKVHYSPSLTADKINAYDMLRELFKDYPVEEGKSLSGIKDFKEYFDTLKAVVNGELLDDINALIQYFESDFKINTFLFKTEVTADGRPEPVINIEIDFQENPIEHYHSFLNEARLSALAVSIYFAIIRKLLGTLKSECLKILVLDDLLISLDMSNRLKLLEILKSRFTDFQIFFFTHDKELFEIYRHKMPWEQYELYLDDTDPIHKPIIKKGSSLIERAKEFYARKEYDCCALLQRKEFEKILKAYLTPKEQLDKNCNELDLAGLIGRAISKSSGEAKTILEKLNIDRKHILNPLSHNDDRSIYSQELKAAMSDLEKLKTMLK